MRVPISRGSVESTLARNIASLWLSRLNILTSVLGSVMLRPANSLYMSFAADRDFLVNYNAADVDGIPHVLLRSPHHFTRLGDQTGVRGKQSQLLPQKIASSEYYLRLSQFI